MYNPCKAKQRQHMYGEPESVLLCIYHVPKRILLCVFPIPESILLSCVSIVYPRVYSCAQVSMLEEASKFDDRTRFDTCRFES